MTILLIGGSPAHPSSSSRLLQYIGEQFEALGHPYQRIHIRELPAQPLLLGQRNDPALQKALEAVARAEQIVIATPIYNAAYAGLLKTFLDLLPQNGLAGKVILPVATAGGQGHLLALDYALRPVLQALEARQVLSSVFVSAGELQWSEELGVTLSANIAERIAAGVAALSATISTSRSSRAGALAASEEV